MRNLESNEIESVSGGSISTDMNFFMTAFRTYFSVNAGKLPVAGGFNILNLVTSLVYIGNDFLTKNYRYGLQSANWLRGYLTSYFTEAHANIDKAINNYK